jgi:chorismate mutase / prephenate dehydratase
MTTETEIVRLRSQIDACDARIVEALNVRARLAMEIGHLKNADGAPVFRPDREAQILRSLEEQSQGPLPAQAIERIYVEILSACRALERPVRVGYLGPEGTYTHEAARRRFGASAEYVPCTTFHDVFRETERQSVDYGVVGIENSTAGSVDSTLDALLESSVQVCAEMELPISHNLLSHGQLSQITRVHSHPQAIAQCRRWLSEHLPHADVVEESSTAHAVRMAVEPTVAAIGPETAGEIYGVPSIVKSIEDVRTNVTRFLVVGQERSGRTGRDKSAVVFSMKDRSGALSDTLVAFARHGVNLTRIESRPSRRKLWEYVFFVEFNGHPEDEHVTAALAELDRQCYFVKTLGAWPAT